MCRNPCFVRCCCVNAKVQMLFAPAFGPMRCSARLTKANSNWLSRYLFLFLRHFFRNGFRTQPSAHSVARDFCRECGTPLTYRRVAVDRISVTVGSLDQPYDFPSEVQYGIENRPHFADRITQGDGITSAQSTARAPGNYATRQHPDHDTHEWPRTSVGNAPSNSVRR